MFLDRNNVTAPVTSGLSILALLCGAFVTAHQAEAEVITLKCDNLAYNERAFLRWEPAAIRFKIVRINVESLFISVEDYVQEDNRTVNYSNGYRFTDKYADGTPGNHYEQVVNITHSYIIFGTKSLDDSFPDGKEYYIDRLTGLMKEFGHPFQCSLMGGHAVIP